MNRLKYLLTTLLITIFYCFGTSMSVELNSKKYENLILVLLDTKSMIKIANLIRMPELLSDLEGEHDFEATRNLDIKNIELFRDIAINGELLELNAREINDKNDANIKNIYKSFISCFYDNKLQGTYEKFDNFKKDYRLKLIENDHSLSDTIGSMFDVAIKDGNKPLNGIQRMVDIEEYDNNRIVNIKDERVAFRNGVINKVWTEHALFSIINGLRNIDTNKKIFLFIPPKLSANANNIKRLVSYLNTTKILRIKSEKDNCDRFIFGTGIMKQFKNNNYIRGNIFNIFADERNVSFVKVAKILVSDKLLEINKIEESKEVKLLKVTNNIDLEKLTTYIIKLNLIEKFKNKINIRNEIRNVGINESYNTVKSNIEKKTTLTNDFINEIFFGNYKIVDKENMADYIFDNLPEVNNNSNVL